MTKLNCQIVSQYGLLTGRETGLEFGRGSYAMVVEVDYKPGVCAVLERRSTALSMKVKWTT